MIGLDRISKYLMGIIVIFKQSLTVSAAPYLAIFEQGGSADIFSPITWGAEMTLLRAL